MRLKIIGNLETMHDSDLPTFLIISLPIIFKRTVLVTVDSNLEECLISPGSCIHELSLWPYIGQIEYLRGMVIRVRADIIGRARINM